MVFKRFSVAFVALSILLIFIEKSSAIKCWNCNSEYDVNCADPFNNKTVGLVSDCRNPYDNTQTPQCRKIKHKVNGQWHYIRGCNINDNLILREAQVSLCNRDACNGAESNVPFFLTMMTAPVLIMRLTSLI